MVIFNPRLDILPPAQQQLWPELRDISKDFTLFGGTGVALHLGHRVSLDFDFFGTKHFDPDELIEAVSFLADASIVQKSRSTLTAIVDRGEPVKVSFFGVPTLQRLDPPLVVEEIGLQVATLRELAGTKMAVVQKRAEAKDYIDVDAIIDQGKISLPVALAVAMHIYGKQFNPELSLKALCFFGDGNLNTLSKEIQERLLESVRLVDLLHLPSVLK